MDIEAAITYQLQLKRNFLENFAKQLERIS